MRAFCFLSLVLFASAGALPAQERPLVKSSQAAALAGKAATVHGRVIEVRRVANGPIIFEIDGRPSAPQFRALVYPMAVERFAALPEQVYLGKDVEVTGSIILRNELPQMWISDPSHIRLRKTQAVGSSPTTPGPETAEPHSAH